MSKRLRTDAGAAAAAAPDDTLQFFTHVSPALGLEAGEEVRLTLPGVSLHAGGAALGVGAILATKPLLDAWGGSESIFRGMEAADARRALLLCLVMFAHSATEGVSIGVSYTGRHALGRFVALSLAIHNIPEGLVTCLALVPRGVPPHEAALWAVLTSLSQPLLAPLAFSWLLVFRDLLAPGLGFAAGAMAYVAAAELLPEAREQLRGQGGRRLLVAVTACAGAAMLALSHLVRGAEE